jgi:hypothetical protein
MTLEKDPKFLNALMPVKMNTKKHSKMTTRAHKAASIVLKSRPTRTSTLCATARAVAWFVHGPCVVARACACVGRYARLGVGSFPSRQASGRAGGQQQRQRQRQR